MDYGQIIIALSAAITLLGVIFTLFKNNSISEKAVDRTTQAEGKLSVEHDKLSTEHRQLSIEQQLILERTVDGKRMVEKLGDTVAAIRTQQTEERVERKIQYLTLEDAQKKLFASAEDMGKFAQDYMRLASTLDTLQKETKREKADLQEALDQQKGESEKLRKEIVRLRHLLQ